MKFEGTILVHTVYMELYISCHLRILMYGALLF